MRPRALRPGFTLIELLIAMVIASIIGVSFTKLLMNQSRFFDHETNIRQARSIARNASNILLSDLRMVQDKGGVTAAAANGKSITVIVPYRFGLVCNSSNLLKTTVSMLPTDSSTIAGAIYGGWAWRNTTTGVYNIITATNPLTTGKPVTSTSSSDCTGGGGAQITTVSMNGRTGSILDIPTLVSSGATVGSTMFLWQKITYTFAADTSGPYPGKIALWRDISGGTNEEIMGPFDTTAHFEFYQSGSDTPTTTPPAVTLIRGLDLVLNADSPRTVAGGTMSTTKVVTSVFFKNVSSF